MKEGRRLTAIHLDDSKCPKMKWETFVELDRVSSYI